ncbi:DUF2339 domain-containing protein [Sphingomonas sp. S-NIH.Pt15_0812]|uniref:DUF2339 domain-containing protein n=1 Tax=Sphingomonas sp. S-NIH.Pt15_0812 TaxID=1920129 RepID=UPI000F7EC812|nr:DUF2339 domain-containing protein [Sphingomonas sp. S-NIH.Pt15_0812]RSU45914.1 DUF2339 domain-containing protein [Sphingomonas sp. S-NIH.Pt15_0812]
MSLLLLIVCSVALALLSQEVRRLRERVDMLEAGATASPISAAGEAPRTVYVPPEPFLAVDRGAYRRVEPIAEAVALPPAPVVEPSKEADIADSATIETSPPSSRFEDVFGRRLPIWAGGLTLAVAGVLIVRYSIEAGLLSPWVRVVFGLIFGAGLIGGAEVALRRDAVVRDPRVRQALAGAGIATLYAVTLAAVHLYDLIGPGTAFVGMALVTVLAGALAMRFGAPSALLGLAGGLAAPALVGAGAPNIPLLTLYLALTVGGLCALGRQQRWWWLGALALVGGFGWGAMLILGGALDLAAALSVGAYTLALAIALPLLLTGDRAALLRAGASVLGCAQLAALVAMGGFAPLHWGVFGLISVAILWLSRREAVFADLPALALGVAILLACAWPAPSVWEMAALLVALVAIHAVPAALRVWRTDTRVVDAPMVAAVAVAIGVLPALRFQDTGVVTLLGAALAAGVAARGWRVGGRADDARFATVAITAAGMIALAAVQLLPLDAWASVAAVLCAGMMTLADRASDRRIERAAWSLGAATLAVLAVDAGIGRLFGEAGGGHVVAWIVPACIAAGMALRARGLRAAVIQPAAVALGYGAAAQVLPVVLIPLVPAVLLAGMAVTRRAAVLPASVAAACVAVGWSLMPLVAWVRLAAIAAGGVMVPAYDWPALLDAALRLACPGAALLAAARLLPQPVEVRRVAVGVGGGLLAITVHVALQHAVGIDSPASFAARTMMADALWESLLALAAVGAWRFGVRDVARVLGAAALAHGLWFTGLVLNPLVVLQQPGPWLALSYGVMGAVLWAVPRVVLGIGRLRDGALMGVIVVAAFTLLRQVSHAPMPLWTGAGAGEQIARSILALVLAGAFLGIGIRRQARDWRFASLALMLVAVAKVFLFNAAGLDGLARIASFAALGFSLIGVGWLYSHYLPDASR